MMNRQYHVSGLYQARYPNGFHTGQLGISTSVLAENKKAAKRAVSKKAIAMHGYVQFNWLNVEAKPISTEG